MAVVVGSGGGDELWSAKGEADFFWGDLGDDVFHIRGGRGNDLDYIFGWQNGDAGRDSVVVHGSAPRGASLRVGAEGVELWHGGGMGGGGPHNTLVFFGVYDIALVAGSIDFL